MAKVKKTKPGVSNRTPVKHWILDSHLGQICGVLSMRLPNVPAIPDPFICVDLCAGDGMEVNEEPNRHEASARIILHHAELLAQKGFRVESTFIEKDIYTFEQLESSVADQTEKMKSGEYKRENKTRSQTYGFSETKQKISLVCGDASKYVIRSRHDRQAVFVNCDPNSIAHIPLTREFMQSFTKGTTMTTTLGCNPAGTKRLSREKREDWFDVIRIITDRMPSWHDAILVRLIKDDAQWAYLTRLPDKWSEDTAKNVKEFGTRIWTKGVEVASLRRNPVQFQDMTNALFLTKAEVKNG